jgi:hypothetical protein
LSVSRCLIGWFYAGKGEPLGRHVCAFDVTEIDDRPSCGVWVATAFDDAELDDYVADLDSRLRRWWAVETQALAAEASIAAPNPVDGLTDLERAIKTSYFDHRVPGGKVAEKLAISEGHVRNIVTKLYRLGFARAATPHKRREVL